MNYQELRKQTNRGWNTWNTLNVLSYSHLPDGFTVNLCMQEYADAAMLRESLIGRSGDSEEKIVPGARTYGINCSQMTLSWRGMKLDIRTTGNEEELIVLITPLEQTCLKTPKLVVEACLMWGREGVIGKKDGRLNGECGGYRHDIHISAETENAVYTRSLSPAVSVLLDRPIVISSRPCTPEEALARWTEEKVKLDAINNAYGAHSEAYTAMKTCLAWDTIYEMEHDRICSTVSRIWNGSGYILFDWDTYFAALMASPESKELAQLNAIAITEEVTADGFIPNYGTTHGRKSYDRSQPPVGSFVCLEIFRKYPERWFAEHIFDTLLGWNRWFAQNRMTEEGYLCWGSNPYTPVTGNYWEMHHVHDTAGGALESGLDNSPMYDDAAFDPDRNFMLLADVGLMGLYIMDCRALAELAVIVDRTDVTEELDARRKSVEAALQTMWDEEFGLFLNRDLRDGTLSRRISPTNFYALHADSVTETQKRRMMDEHFYNPEEFWGDYMMPSIARNDPAYPEQNYWRGRIWAPMNYLAYAAMKYAGLYKECCDLADKSEALILKEWRLHGHVHENYCADTGMGCNSGSSDKFYHWGGLLSYIALDCAQISKNEMESNEDT